MVKAGCIKKVAVIDMFIFLGHVWCCQKSLSDGSTQLGHWARGVGRGEKGKGS